MAEARIAGSRLPAQCELPGCNNKADARKAGYAVCNKHYLRHLKYGQFTLPSRPDDRPATCCSVDGCNGAPRSTYVPWCEKHYMRKYRKGTTDLHQAKPVLVHSAGYLVDRAPGHPLATEGNRAYVYQHRRVFYEAHGEGPFNCHWCGVVVGWSDMHVDHVDADKQNNELANLVASCPRCNQARGLPKLRRSMAERRGRHVSAFGETLCLSEWSRRTGLSGHAIAWRLDRLGWSPEDAVSAPRITHSGRRQRHPATGAEVASNST